MRFTFPRAGLLLGSLCFFVAGCALPAASPNPKPPDDEEVIDPSIDAILAFDGPSIIELTPGESRDISVSTSPAGEHEIFFALFDAPSDSSLDAGHAVAGKDGRATVTLHAPSAPASFTLHAWIEGGPSADLTISVSKLGVGAIEVVPEYKGPRPVGEWVASVIAGTTCDALKGQLPGEPEGAFVAVDQAPENPLIQSIPVGPKLAVTVRAEHFAFGCTDAHDIAPGATTQVKVHVVDVPPTLDKAALDLRFDYAPEAGLYSKILSKARSELLGSFLTPQQAEAGALLDAMVDAAADPAELAEARAAAGWDALAALHFAQLPATLGSRMNKWIDLGLGGAAAELTGHMKAIEGVPGKALFYADHIGGLDALEAGAPPVHLLSWTAGPDDKFFLSGDVYFVPSRFIGAAGKAGAVQDLPGVETMADALAEVAACGDLAAALGATATCDTACLEALCRTAFAAKWQAALDASAAGSSVVTIDIGASGGLQVDDYALPVELSGTWLGHVTMGEASALTTGNVTGKTPPEEAPEEPPSSDPPQ